MKIVLSEIAKDNPLEGLNVHIEGEGKGKTCLAEFTICQPLRNKSYYLIWRELFSSAHQPDKRVLDIIRHDNNVTRVLYAYALEYAEKLAQVPGDTFVDKTGFAGDKPRTKPIKRKSQ